MSEASGRIVFAGSPAFAVPSLEAVASGRHELCAVLTQPDRPAGRGRATRAGPVKEAATRLRLPVFQPASLRTESAQRMLRDLSPDLIVVVAYGLLLPAAVLRIPARGCVNVHASLLPRWRGASPIQAAIRAGDRETGVSLMQMDRGLDTGPVLAQARVDIEPGETAGELHDRLARLGAELLHLCLDDLVAGRLEARPQATRGITHAGLIDKKDAVIDWHRPAGEIARLVRAFNPWPVAETTFDGQRLRVWDARAEEAADGPGPAGQILSADEDGVVVSTGRGVLRLLSLQMPGRQRVPAAAFAHGYAPVGRVLGQ